MKMYFTEFSGQKLKKDNIHKIRNRLNKRLSTRVQVPFYGGGKYLRVFLGEKRKETNICVVLAY